MKPPSDQGAIASKPCDNPCEPQAEPWILAATILGSSMGFIDSTIVSVALPALQSHLGGTVIDMQWVVEAYALTLGALILVGGSAGDLFGRRRVFLLGAILFAVASAACGIAPNIHALVAARAVQGVGAAFLVPGSLSILRASFSEQTRGRTIGTWSGFTAITSALGPVLGGWLIEHASWRWAFFINIPLAVATIAISLWRVPESKDASSASIDWAGALIATAGLGALAYGLIESGSRGWRSPSIWAALAVGVLGLLGFLRIESRAKSPMVPLELFRSRNFSGANLLTFFLYSALAIFFFLYPLDLIQAQHYTATATGAAALPFILLIFVLSRWTGGLVARFGPRGPLIFGPLIVAAGFLLFAVPSVSAVYWHTFFPAFLTLGLGMAISIPPLTTVAMDSSGPSRAGAASGINNAVARVAGLLATAVLGVVMVNAFSVRLNRNLRDLAIPSDALQELKSNEIRLAALPIPAGIDVETAAAVRTSIDSAFVFAFRSAMMFCAALSIAGASIAWRMISSLSSVGRRVQMSEATRQG